jgi:DNA-binding MarR family transcriptional regulator
MFRNACLDTYRHNTYFSAMPNDLLRDIRQSKPFSSLEEEAFLNLVRTASEFADGIELLLKDFGISAAQYNVLRILRGAGPTGLCRNEIRDRLVARMPDVTRLLDRLESLGLVRRVRDTEDRRQVGTFLTDSGAELLARLDDPVETTHRNQLRHLSADELRTLIALTTRARTARDTTHE